MTLLQERVLTLNTLSEPQKEHQEHLAAASTHQLQSNPKLYTLNFTCFAAATRGQRTPQQSAHQPRLRSVSKGQ